MINKKINIRFIDKNELKEFFNLNSGEEEDEEILLSMFREADLDKDSLISVKEFQQVMFKLCNKLI